MSLDELKAGYFYSNGAYGRTWGVRQLVEIAADAETGEGPKTLADLAIRTTFIVGYPGETEEEFERLLDFVREVRFDRVGAFAYSPEEGTPAADLSGAVPEEVKAERYERLMALQQGISLAINEAQVGRTLDVLVEGQGDGLSVGRSYRDAPEIDGMVILSGRLSVGSILPVRITGAMEYDLLGEGAGEPG